MTEDIAVKIKIPPWTGEEDIYKESELYLTSVDSPTYAGHQKI